MNFVGYHKYRIKTETEVTDQAGVQQEVTVFTDHTPFYATSGGQHGDCGTIRTATGVVEVETTKKAIGDKIGHVGRVTEGYIEKGQKAVMDVNAANRLACARNHSATHLLQKALRNVLGSHIEQAGSDVTADRLRFDFTHFQAMSAEELEARCRKCMRIEVSDAAALARVLDGMQAEYRILEEDRADIYAEIPVTALVSALERENCAVISLREQDESLESFYMNLIGGGQHA